jgi:hypothetical protein
MLWNIKIAHRYMNVGIGNEAAHSICTKCPLIYSIMKNSTTLDRCFKYSKIIADLPQKWQFADLRFTDQIVFDLRTSANPQILTSFLSVSLNIGLKCSNSKFVGKIK